MAERPDGSAPYDWQMISFGSRARREYQVGGKVDSGYSRLGEKSAVPWGQLMVDSPVL
jgi:hypothetical protein